VGVNENHALCASPEWAEYLQTDVLPRLADGIELGPRLLEVGPGPGAATDWLRHRVTSLTAVEIASFTMLHHVPTRRDQDRILAEALRVLRPGGVLIASDSVPGTGLHEFHAGDTYNPVEPATLIARLQTIGFGAMNVDVGHAWAVRAFKADPDG
jgi:hypothetical protein